MVKVRTEGESLEKKGGKEKIDRRQIGKEGKTNDKEKGDPKDKKPPGRKDTNLIRKNLLTIQGKQRKRSAGGKCSPLNG